MINNETNLLRKEIERLNQIIDIILDKNKQLELTLAAYQNAFGGQPPSIYSSQPSENALTPMYNSNQNMDDGTKKLSYSNHKDENGINTVNDSNDQFVDGNNNVLNSNHYFKNGINNLDNSNDKFVNGIGTKDNSNPENVNGISNHAGNTGEDKVGINNSPLNAAVAALKQVMHKTSDKGIRNTAIILLQLQQQPVNSLLSLRQLTHLSAGGMAKRIMALKKYGYITRTGFQQYQLTEKSLQILEAANK